MPAMAPLQKSSPCRTCVSAAWFRAEDGHSSLAVERGERRGRPCADLIENHLSPPRRNIRLVIRSTPPYGGREQRHSENSVLRVGCGSLEPQSARGTSLSLPLPLRKTVTWLILPVVICLSQRLSHACLSIKCLYVETANGSLNQL